jgi:hypothetical protein
MKYMVLTWLLALLLPSCSSVSRPGSAISNSVEPNSITLGNRDVHTKNSVFIFRDVMLDEDTLPGSWIINGIVHNDTDRDWSKVTFNMYLYDISENILGGNITFFINFLKRRFQKSFSINYINFSGIGYPPASVSRYDVAFKEQAQQKYKFIMIKPYENRDLYFEDKFVKIIFSISREQIGFIISNKTNEPIRIDWNQCSYIDVDNLAHAIIHTGV